MKTYQIKKLNEGIIANKVRVASGVFDRMLGLMFSKNLGDWDGLLISPCRSIHTFFMRYDLDVIFLNKENKVIKIIRNMKPWRLSWIYFRSDHVLEMAGGSLSQDVKEGDDLEVLCIS